MTQILGVKQNLEKKMPRSARPWSEFIAELEVHNCFYNASIISMNAISARIIENSAKIIKKTSEIDRNS